MTGQEHGLRDVEVVDDLGSDYAYRELWALIVGISSHAHSPWDLRFAHRDADELAKLLKNPSYGGLDDVHMKVLLNEQATTAAITRALRSFLRKPARQDLVLLHFSCHGTPDPDGLDEVYLVTHDTDPDDIAATAVPMREIDFAVEKTLKAERVVILADTCHSGALGNRNRSTKLVAPSAQVLASHLSEVGKSKRGKAWLMSAEASEVSLEDERWGGGHGLFTFHVIEGLKGGAERDGRVRVGDLFTYVDERVRKDSENRQHPIRGMEQFARDLVLATTAHLSAEEHFQIGRLLDGMGRLFHDPRRLESASEQLRWAFDKAAESNLPMPRAAILHGLARLSLREGDRALAAFDAALKAAGEDLDAAADARFHRTLALLDDGRPLGEVLTALDDFLSRHEADPRADCAREMRRRIETVERSRQRALLIGIAEYQRASLNLRGPTHDLKILSDVLVERLGFLPADVRLLSDAAATRSGILAALADMARESNPDDVVVVYFAGHGYEGTNETYWVAHDTDPDTGANALKGAEIHAALRAIRSSQTIALIDTHPNDNYLDLIAADGGYTLVLGASPGEMAYETAGDAEVPEPHGVFTLALVRVLRQGAARELRTCQLRDRLIEEVRRLGYQPADSEAPPVQTGPAEAIPRAVRRQTPKVIGNEDQVLFSGLPDFAELFRFSRNRGFARMTIGHVENLEQKTRSLSCPFSGFRYGLGRAYLEQGRADLAIPLLEGVPPTAPEGGEAGLALACSYLERDREEDARRALDAAIATRAAPENAWERSALDHLRTLVDRGIARRRALLVGINAYVAPEVPNPGGAVADVDALNAVLVDRWGFRPEDVTILTDAAATRDAILAGFRSLAEAAREAPCIFAFSGVGSTDSEGRPGIISVDSRQRPDLFDDIDVEELTRIAGPSAPNLIAILDAGWTHTSTEDEELLRRGRCAPSNVRSRIAARDLGSYRELSGLSLGIGRTTIYSESLRVDFTGRSVVEELLPDPEPGTTAPKLQGRLMHALTSALRRLDPDHATASAWLAEAFVSWTDPNTKQRTDDPVVISETETDAPLFGSSASREVLTALRRVERGPIAELVPRLKRLIEKQRRPEFLLNLGLAHEALDDRDAAIDAFEDARDHEEATSGIRAEARYHLGRVLYERNRGTDLDRAIGELREAIAQDAGLTGAFYYLGRALRDSARRNLDDLAVQAFRKYLDGDAPLGHRDEVRRWMNPGRNVTTSTL
ncbi:caspase family protein [Tautonia plasticadhaerens]|uniref:Caspase domain protein n=1 Tax=Tautonia plasticadhaerens TaxID=2527974 RepID=A0A518H9P3_9BACT|nr:caspase family protein [Tautonia plasticadhaerens]QDV37456.1 Caspase domain protein [Tautonia plasticadhaerens]